MSSVDFYPRTAWPGCTKRKMSLRFFRWLVVMATLGVVLAPLAHRIMHKFHLDETGDD